MTETQARGQSRAASDLEDNEDYFIADDSLGLYVVCDGASTEAGGEIASNLAANAVRAFIRRRMRGRGFRSAAFSLDTAVEGIDAAFDAIFQQARVRPALARMTTTLTMLLVTGDRAVVGHVGDSRLYLVRDDCLSQLTLDHPMTADGAAPQSVGVDAFELALQPGDVFLLCTDGAVPVLADEPWVLRLVRDRDVSRIAERLVERAGDLDQHRDATVVVIRVDDDSPHTRLQHSTSSEGTLFQDLLAAAAAGPA